MHSEPPTDEYLRNVGQKLKHYREKSSLKQSDVALALDVEINTVQRYESGEIHLPLRKATKFARLVGMPVEELQETPGNSR